MPRFSITLVFMLLLIGGNRFVRVLHRIVWTWPIWYILYCFKITTLGGVLILMTKVLFANQIALLLFFLIVWLLFIWQYIIFIDARVGLAFSVLHLFWVIWLFDWRHFLIFVLLFITFMFCLDFPLLCIGFFLAFPWWSSELMLRTQTLHILQQLVFNSLQLL